ncbi:cellulose synthase [Nonomuraea sp. NPDC050202]|jgi:heme exporter protein D|uniref:cellulose synthase n=1 Tax=Nonomuraea sp. NPDC050202 TaxID=3155035 RepID=UPI0033E8309F
MGNFEAIAWLPLCAGVSLAGLALAFLAFRRRGAAAGLRVTAWALLPVAAYLTGALQALWRIGATVAGFVTGLVFNPAVWAGVAVAGLSVVLFVVSGVMRGRKLSPGRKKKSDAADAPAQGGPAKQAPAAGKAQQAPGKPQRPAVSQKPASKGDDDFSDIEELLKRRGIS